MRDTQSFEKVVQIVDCLKGLVHHAQEDAAIYIVKELQKYFILFQFMRINCGENVRSYPIN